jgi:hypothetical protein
MIGVASLFSAAALLPGAAVFRPPAVAINRASSIRLTADTEVFTPPTVEDRALLARAGPSPVLQPRELIQTMMQCLHSSSWDDPRPYFGFEVALRFLSPSHQCFGFLPRDFFRYLRQPHKQTLINWNEYKWAGDTTILEGEEAYQQLTVCDKEGVCQSVRFMLVRVSPNAEPHSQWAVDAVFVAEPDEEVKPDDQKWLVDTVTSPLPPGEAEDLFAQFDANGDGAISMSEFKDAVARLGIARSEDELRTVVEEVDADRSGVIEYDEFEKLLSMVNERCKLGKLATDVIASKTALEPSKVVETVMQALRKPDDPYPLHGAEVAIRYCSPTNRASQLSPQSFAQYLREPWYAILTEWDEMELEEEDEDEEDEDECDGTAEQDVLVKREGDDSWTIVNWQLSKHNGRWLTDSLTIN